MNRLIIIGNGFDLAHKMKTSYYDFIFGYIKKAFLQARNQAPYSDELIEVRKRVTHYEAIDIDSMDELKSCLISDTIARRPVSFLGYNTSRVDNHDHRRNVVEFEWKIKNKFIEHLFINCCNYGWVDIENEYYNMLKKILYIKQDKEKNISEHNSAFHYLIVYLENYLIEQKTSPVNPDYNKIFSEKIKKEDIATITLQKDESPSQSLFLNLNYTSTIDRYNITNDPDEGFSNIYGNVNYIHGELNKKDNPIIFGFGDEFDKDYSKIEGEKVKGFLNYMKSFGYFKTSNYHDLIRFIEAENFQIFIMGHSCGLSDRTMLNMIFEHNNCKSIKIFYYGDEKSNNYTELTQEISRHFSNKGEMRKKIVSFNNSSAMPQIKMN
jgi:Bacteriophage abortive infection AbiH